MAIAVEQFKAWLGEFENENLEFKAARNQYETDKVLRYCSALANENGGKLILGVSDKKPRSVVGTHAFSNLNSIKSKLVAELQFYVDVMEIQYEGKRVIVFDVPSRPIGRPIPYKGSYLMRSGEELIAMTPDRLKRIFEETGVDYSAEICAGADIDDLHPAAIENMRSMWKRKRGDNSLDNLEVEQLLDDAELIVDSGVTYAALILLGTAKAMTKYVSDAEVIFEYRSSEASTPYQQRENFREGFFLFSEKIWSLINARNQVHRYESGLFVRDIPEFDSTVIREALLNAISHRDYRVAGSIHVKQYPAKLEIISPGGFAPGVNPQNILRKQVSRNRRIAEVFAKCGLVERSGQGSRIMLERTVKEGKPWPNYSGTDGFEVFLTLRGEIQNPKFIDFLQEVGNETLATFSTQDFLLIDLVHREQNVPEELEQGIPRLRELGIIESQGRGSRRTYFLSRKFYSSLGKGGTYTRMRGLDKGIHKELLYKHIFDNRKQGAQFSEFAQVLPNYSRGQIKGLLEELKRENRIHAEGMTRAARWYPGERN